MRIYLQRSAPIQPKTSEILPKNCQKLATTLRGVQHEDVVRAAPVGPEARVLRLRLEVEGVPVRGGRDLGKIRKISKILQFFGGLVLGCIKTKFCKKICV